MEEQEILHHQLSGISVVTTEGREVGRFREVRDLKSATPLRGHGEDGEHLIPFTQELLVGLSPEEAALVIDFFFVGSTVAAKASLGTQLEGGSILNQLRGIGDERGAS